MIENEIGKAKEKALSLLLHKDRTKRELQERLYRAGFSKEAVEGALSYAESFRYIDDFRYASNYIHFHKGQKSKKELSYKLRQKGIDKEIIEEMFHNCDDIEALQHTIDKRLRGREILSFDTVEKQKLMAYLARRGFSIHDIKRQLDRKAY